MYKIILADDEPIILRGLEKMLDWKSLDAEVVGTAIDGKQLLELIPSLKPNIIISDIAMPNRSGLDVIRSIREKHWNIKVIFLSAYQEFNYAKQAITYGAVDYLLKPATKNELEHAVRTAENQLIKEDSATFLQQGNTLLNILQITDDHSKSKNLDDEVVKLKAKFDPAFLACASFTVTSVTMRNMNTNQMTIIRFSIFQFIREYVEKTGRGLVLSWHENRCDTLFALPPTNAGLFLQRTAEAILNRAKQDYHADLTVGIGDVVENVSDLKYAYKTADFAINLHYFQPEPIICYEEFSKGGHRSSESYDDAYRTFFRSVIQKENTWKENLEKCLDIIENLYYGNRCAAENHCITMAIVFYKDLSEYKLTDSSCQNQQQYENAVGTLQNQATFRDLKREMICLFQKLVDSADKNANQECQTIYRVKDYIDHHFSEDITLEDIAKRVYMNPCYFSVFFKRKTGKNFKKYLTRVRMKEALILLNGGDMKTSELANAVGYKDVRTFTNKFREIYGNSPAALKRKKNAQGRS
mgnify:FL=1